jgi:hypothetical protein
MTLRNLKRMARFGWLAGIPMFTFAASIANAQVGGPYDLTWSAIACGGLTAGSAAGPYAVAGTVGQSDAGKMAGSAFIIHGGFWSVVSPDECYANCDGSTLSPVLNVNDFICFQAAFATAQSLPLAQQITSYANCDHSTNPPVLNVNDFICFQAAFAAGCQ